MQIGFLHTADVHVATFDALVAEMGPQHAAIHVVDESLLADARAGDTSADFATRLASRIQEATVGSDIVVCTCSTIGGLAERIGTAGVPVIRIDRPMMEAALSVGSRIGVAATVESTLSPTVDLLQVVAAESGQAVHPVVRHVADAWPLFEAGDQDGYHRCIAEAVDDLAAYTPLDAIVLAQASMAAATTLCLTKVPVFSSPRLAVRAALDALSGR